VSIPKEPLLSYWYKALHSPRGVCLVVNDPERIRQKLYAARREAKDAALDNISVCPSPLDPTRLWLVKKEPSSETS
jgi:hypothetical protein